MLGHALSEREAGVVRMRFGLTDGQPKTLDEIGKVYGVTRERIRQIESKTMSQAASPIALARCCATTWTRVGRPLRREDVLGSLLGGSGGPCEL
ncbi:MAG: sigma factor-like helix-turn-helix DNA-binding protein [Candidatus Nanopelagicales bacterium]